MGAALMAEFFDFEMGSFDVQMRLPELSTGEWVRVKTDTTATPADVEEATPVSSVRVTKITDGYRLTLHRTDGTEIDRFEIDHPSGPAELQITAHNDSMSVFLDGRWLHTFFPTYVHYEIIPAIELWSSGGITVTDVLAAELFDCRDRLEIDLQASLANAISSVLGQKPIKAWATWDGAVCYAYEPGGDTHTIYRATMFERVRSLPQQAASDVLVVHQRLAALSDLAALAEFGLMTQLVRAPEIGSGAVRIGQYVLESGRQAAQRYTANGPIDPRIEMYDTITVVVRSPDAEVGYEAEMVVDTLSFTGGTRPKMALGGNQP